MFVLDKTDPQSCARRGRLITPHGTIETPVFMNVATCAAIKGGLSAFDLKDVNCQVMLSNTYHLHIPRKSSQNQGRGRLLRVPH